jgi:hypothetical protein
MPGGTRVTVDGMELGVTPATATLKPGAHTVEVRFGRSMRTRQITVNAGERTVERIDWSRKPSGTLQVSSTPSGAKVLVDGAERGTTPVTLDDVAAGTHTVVLQSSEGSIKRSVTVKADQTALIDETIYSGWVTLYSPFELTITEGSRPLRLDDRNQVMLPAGPHDLRFENRTFGYSEVKHVDIQPGHGTTLSIAPPKSLLNVSASAPAEVLVDGASIGQTPITDAPIDIGTRDVVVRSTSGEEKRQTITVTTRPVTLTIDFAK